MSEFSVIGKPVALIDSAGKTTGAGKYADDLTLPGMLIAKILHSPYPHAVIKRIDATRALAVDGVVTIVTGHDAPNKYGILPVGHDETALAVDKVRYVGDNEACIVADSESVADRALELIDPEMPMAQIRVIKPLVGGGFGGKSEIIPLEIITAVAARKAKAPVKITYTREEVFWAHRGRPRTIVDLKTGVRKDGRITAVAARVIQDGGAYCSYGVVTILYSGALLGALYDIPNIRYDGYRVLTNKPACGAMRGHGTVNVRFAFESQ